MTKPQAIKALHDARKKITKAIEAYEYSRGVDDTVKASQDLTDAINELTDAQTEWNALSI
jgi:hypothetical protein